MNCIKCKKDIEKKEYYVEVNEFNNKKLKVKQYFHKRCYEELFNIKKMALGMVGKVNKLMGMVGLPEEEMEVKI